MPELSRGGHGDGGQLAEEDAEKRPGGGPSRRNNNGVSSHLGFGVLLQVERKAAPVGPHTIWPEFCGLYSRSDRGAGESQDVDPKAVPDLLHLVTDFGSLRGAVVAPDLVVAEESCAEHVTALVAEIQAVVAEAVEDGGSRIVERPRHGHDQR